MKTARRDLWLSPLLITVVVILGYGIGPTRLPLIGDETCRTQHAIEMVASGDWVIPTQQGMPLPDRPPFQYWTLAIVHKWIHPLDHLTIRTTAVFITLATGLLVWWYARRLFSPAAAFLSGVSFPTMGHVFDLGRRVETDGLFTLLLAAALLLWHVGYAGRWGPVWTWHAGSFVAALATLTKGTQGPVTFFGTVYLFLLMRRDWRFLRHWSHFTGLLLFVGLIAAWQVPFFRAAGWPGTYYTWFQPSTSRLATDLGGLLTHLVSFPFEVFGASLPWSALLLGLLFPAFWRLGDDQRSAVLFALLGIAVVFIPVWINAGGKPRYTMPLEPLIAVVCGAVAHQCIAAETRSALGRLWRGFFRTWMVNLAMVAAALSLVTVLAGLTTLDYLRELAQPWPLLVLLVSVAAAGTALVFRNTSTARPTRPLVPIFVLAASLALAFNGPVLNDQIRKRSPVGPEVLALRESLPPGTQLMSFGPLHAHFVYWYQWQIPILPRVPRPDQVPDELEYFAIDIVDGDLFDLPFEWEEVTRINMDPNKHPAFIEVIGRRHCAGDEAPANGKGRLAADDH